MLRPALDSRLNCIKGVTKNNSLIFKAGCSIMTDVDGTVYKEQIKTHRVCTATISDVFVDCGDRLDMVV